MRDVFISFSSGNMDKAQSMCEFLEENGFNCFFAKRDIKPGQEYAAQIIERLEKSDAVVLLFSQMANDSPHVLREVEFAVSHKIPIVVYQLESVNISKSMKYFLMTHQWVDFDECSDKKLIKSLNALMSVKEEKKEKAEAVAKNDEKSETDEREGKSKNKTTFLYGIIGILAFIIIAFGALFAKYIIPDLKNNEQAVTSESSEEITEKYKVGDRVIFGKYNDEEIEWRIIHFDEDNCAILLTSDVISIKAFDTAEGGKYNEYEGVDYWSYENHIVEDPDLLVLIRGNNDWSTSNIRTWLNSDREVVEYADQAPTRSASCTSDNYYSSEPGFLYGFSQAEKDTIVKRTNLSEGNLFSDTDSLGYVVSEDFVFLLSEEELGYLKDAGISLFANLTQSALEKDTSGFAKNFSEIHGTNSYYWWLRDHGKDAKVNEGLIVQTEYEEGESGATANASVGATCYGVRPAV
ncbi:MAG: TIR domain-containing protein, partial [Bacteroidia bacterium]|nr:TIR domain-containing protein [Bacteroidia bacterium]